MDLKRQSEHSGLRPDTSSLVNFISELDIKSSFDYLMVKNYMPVLFTSKPVFLFSRYTNR